MPADVRGIFFDDFVVSGNVDRELNVLTIGDFGFFVRNLNVGRVRGALRLRILYGFMNTDFALTDRQSCCK